MRLWHPGPGERTGGSTLVRGGGGFREVCSRGVGAQSAVNFLCALPRDKSLLMGVFPSRSALYLAIHLCDGPYSGVMGCCSMQLCGRMIVVTLGDKQCRPKGA